MVNIINIYECERCQTSFHTFEEAQAHEDAHESEYEHDIQDDTDVS
jgi:hypothetical protein